MNPGDLIAWRKDDRDAETTTIGIIISHEIMNFNDAKLRVSNMFLRDDEKGNQEEVETTTILWVNEGYAYISINHKKFIKDWYEVINDHQ